MHRLSTIVIVVLFISCNKMMTKKYGINYNNPKSISSLIAKVEKDTNFTIRKSLYVNATFTNEILKLYHLNTSKTYYLRQPLQVMYFQNDSMIAYFVNCNAGGFPLLKWNRDDNFSTFPPKTQTNPSTIIKKKFILNLLNPISNNEITQNDKTEYTIVVFWNYLLEKQSRHLIKIVQNNAINQNCSIILVNNDLVFNNNSS